ncbi:MAG: HEAT repeat domain-containing protein [Terriglobales bacterium]
MRFPRTLQYALLSLTLATAVAAQTPAPGTKAKEQADQQYQKALNAINSADWKNAESEMKAARKAMAKAQSGQVSGALYWEAYAAAHLGERTQALAALEKLQSRGQSSGWEVDAAALKLQILSMEDRVAPLPPIPPVPPTPPMSDATIVSPHDELQLLALNGLMNTEPAKAVPLLENVIHGHADTTVKNRALFVLAQNSSPAAVTALVQIAGSNPAASVRSHAVRYLGMMGGAEGAQALEQIYAHSHSVATRRDILSAYMLGGDTPQIIAAAETEKNPQLRTDAIRELGMTGSPQALTALKGLYAGARERSTSEAVIQALFLHNSATALVALARKEKDPGLKEDIVQKLSMMKNPTATAYLEEILKQ